MLSKVPEPGESDPVRPHPTQMKFIFAGLATVSLFVFGPQASGQNVITRVMERISIITTGNYSAGGETEGAAFVGGTYNPIGGRSQFGFNSGAVADDRTNVLFLNNGVASGNGNLTRLLTGSVASRTSVNASSFSLNGNAANNPSINQGASAWGNAMTGLGFLNTQNLVQNIESASSQWRSLTTNSVGSVRNGNEFTFAATSTVPTTDGKKIAIFNVNGNTAFASGIGQLSGSGFAGADTILINVSGVSLTVAQNFVGDLQNNERKVVFNFYEATLLNLDRNFRGTIYAPFATVQQNGSNVDGGVIAKNFVQTAEVHDRNFNSYLPFTSVPEPGSSGLLLGGISLLILFRRR